MKYHIEVTQLDILQGVPGEGLQCPVARAIRRTLGIPVIVHYAGVFLTIPLPPPLLPDIGRKIGSLGPPGDPSNPLAFVLDKIGEFDRGLGMEPFSFDIELDYATPV